MKEIEGYSCRTCRAIVLSYRKKPPPWCPHCRANGQDRFVAEEHGPFEPAPYVLLQLQRVDFPQKPKEDPAQGKLFPEDYDDGSLF